MTVDVVAAEHGVRFSTHRTRAAVARFRLPPLGATPGPALVLAKPASFMNVSGGPVAGLVRFFSVPPGRLLVVHDELDLPFGQLSTSIGTRDYCRLRLGIGRPPGRMDPADFVLRDFATIEREDAAVMVAEAADAVLDVARLGWERAQAEVNARVPPS
jgi:PTH1 family peptidyl-tRNA hydrolase